MKVSSERIEGCQVVLTIEIEPEEKAKPLDEAYHRLVRKVDIPGFRKGKVPYILLEKYIGKETLVIEALKRSGQEFYRQAIKEQNIAAIARPPEIEVIQLEPLLLKAIVQVEPDVKLGDYRSIKLTPPPLEVEERAQMTLRSQLIEAVRNSSKIEFPSAMTEHEIDQLALENFRSFIEDHNIKWEEMGLEDYFSVLEITENELRNRLRPIAEKRVADTLVLYKISIEEGILVSEEEAKAEKRRMGIENISFARLKSELQLSKTLDRLVEIATGKDVKPEEGIATLFSINFLRFLSPTLLQSRFHPSLHKNQ